MVHDVCVCVNVSLLVDWSVGPLVCRSIVEFYTFAIESIDTSNIAHPLSTLNVQCSPPLLYATCV